MLLGAPATGLDTANKYVRLGDRTLDYHALVIATGARARHLPGTDNLAGVHTLRTLDDAMAIRAAWTGSGWTPPRAFRIVAT